MANLDRPMGFRPVSNGMAGTAPQIRHYAVSSTLATAIYEGDILYKNATGPHTLSTMTGTADQIHTLIGVAAAYVKASPGASKTIAVYDDPYQLFEVQSDSTTGLAEVDSMGKWASVTLTAGNTTSLQSKQELDGSTVTGTRDEEAVLQIMEVSKAVGNTAATANCNWIVQISSEAHLFRTFSLTTAL